MLPPESGIPTIRRELVAGGGSRRDRGRRAARHHGRGVRPDRRPGRRQGAGRSSPAAQRPLLMVGQVKAARLYGGLEVETTLDPKVQPFLFDHQIDGVAAAARRHGHRGVRRGGERSAAPASTWRRSRTSRSSLPFKFFRNQPATLHLDAVASPGGDGRARGARRRCGRSSSRSRSCRRRSASTSRRACGCARERAGEAEGRPSRSPAAKALTHRPRADLHASTSTARPTR